MSQEKHEILEKVASGDLSPAQAEQLLKARPPAKRRAFLDPLDALGTPRALLVGLLAVAAGLLLSRWGLRFDGALDLHYHPTIVPWPLAFADAAVSWPLTAAVLWLAALLTSRSTRFIDHLAVVGLARWPHIVGGLILAVVFTFSPLPEPEILLQGSLEGAPPPASVIWAALVGVLSGIWQITWLYRGFRTASGLGGSRLLLTFIGALLSAEVLTKVALYAVS